MPSSDIEPTNVQVPTVLAAQLSGHCPPEPQAISSALGQAFGALMQFIQQHGASPSGPPRCIYTSHGPEGVGFTVAIPIANPPAATPANAPVTVSTLPAGAALRFTHRGPYHMLMATYQQVTQYMIAQGLMQTEADWARYMPMWEEYLNDPQTTPEVDLLTYIYLPMN